MITKAIVTGGAGFLGSVLVDRLIDDGADVLVVDDLSRGRLEYLAGARRRGRLTIHQIDVRDSDLVDLAARFEPQTIFHLAAQIDVRKSVDDPVEDASANVIGTVNVLTAAREAGAERVVFASSGGAIYGEETEPPTKETARRRPASPYGVSKLVVEEYFRYFADAHGVDYVLLGPANIYGPRQDPLGEGGVVAIFARSMLDRRPITIYGDGSQTRDFVYVEDVADAFVRAADRGGARFINIGTGRETSIAELVEILTPLTGYRRKPEFGSPLPGDVARSALDPARAKRFLGWEPWTSLERGLALTVDWMRAH
jgi:UDP-glucose 4-epimerase